MRLVLDTDVLVAGLRSRTGASRILLQAVEAGVIQPLISAAIALEYEAVATRMEQLMAMRLTLAAVNAYLDGFVARAEWISPFYNHGGLILDPTDDKFVTAALNGNAEAVATRMEQLTAMRLTHAAVDAYLDGFVARAEWISPFYNHGGLILDPADDKFVTAAINGNAEAIVIFNVRDYVPRNGRVTGLGINVCRPGDILRRLSWRPSATLPSDSLFH